MRVHPREQERLSVTKRRVSKRLLLGALYHWATWLFICGMVFSQFLCIVWDSTTTSTRFQYGNDPRHGIAPIVGSNDAPYTDRAVVCVFSGAGYAPLLVSQALLSDKAAHIGSASDFRVGYRVIDRHVDAKLDHGIELAYQDTCQLIAGTLDNMFDACTALGYSGLTRDFLRVTVDDDSFAIHGALPILIMPFFDNTVDARQAIPTMDGDACVFRLEGAFIRPTNTEAVLLGVNRTIRHERVVEWLGRSGGTWRHGWYEDPVGDKWGGELMSSNPASEYKMTRRQFDVIVGNEVDCSKTVLCSAREESVVTWGRKIKIDEKYVAAESVYVANASQHGLFLFTTRRERVVYAAYDWKTLLSNASMALLLARWMFAMLTLHHGYCRNETKWHSGGIGCLAGARSFNTLIFAVLPRLKAILCAFWTVGCNFEGQQVGLSEAWFAMYPAIVELVLAYYSVLNVLAKIMRRRMSDALFAPTVIALCLAHYFRVAIASSGWLRGVDTRVPTVMFSDEVERLQLANFFTSDVAMRLNGNVRELFIGKLALLGVNLLPLLLARALPANKPYSDTDGSISALETAMAIRRGNAGGLIMAASAGSFGAASCRRSMRVRGNVDMDSDKSTETARLAAHSNTPPAFATQTSSRSNSLLASSHSPFESYELVRLGYVVYGGKFVLKFDDWDIISTFAPLRAFFHLWNHRVAVWTLEDAAKESENPNKSDGEHKTRSLCELEPKILRLDDPRLLEVPWWHISACDIG